MPERHVLSSVRSKTAKRSNNMLRVCVCVSGGGTNLQAIIDAIDAGRITNAQLVSVISNNKGAYALERAKIKG